MITVSAGYKQEREAYVVGFGLSEDNLVELRKSRPIAVANDRVKLPPPGCDFVILAVKDREAIQNELDTILSRVPVMTDASVPVMYIDNSFYVAVLSKSDGRILYVIILDDISYQKLRDKVFLTFRSRSVEGSTTSIEVIIFWGLTEAEMKQKFEERGLIFDPNMN